ncbi:FtsW/RodA/SpoVE family cell cycle protein [Leptotrichia sp. oral taxon 847]|uniref:FtsW/RodA/SpoVE family cell cycle protein n=1 Tax=Leptotrichia sp. oral taxon 847 TaxID=1785996 RepID=UPI000767F02E|nr:FtsW/RodA/SpoVE family cell cycle protein [Leptotrichia sp. oral taxon 847]AMD95053.1 cell cycle protein [Leptotrichia sp. oral taxon 847]
MFRNKKFLGTAFIIVILLLLVTGLLTMASLSFPVVPKGKSSYYYLSKQALWIFLGLICFSFTALMNYKRYKEFKFFAALYIIGIVGLFMVLILGGKTKGAVRWINVFGFKIQPSEFAKLIIIITVAVLIDRLKNKNMIATKPWTSAAIILGTTGVYSLLILMEKSYTSMAQVAIIGILMLFISGINLSVFTIIFSFLIILGQFLLKLASYRVNRIKSHESGELVFQAHQSLIAIGSGNLTGRGYGNGLQKYKFLPEIHTDYIFSGFAEENGFIGALILILIYVCLLAIILIVACKIKDMFAKYLLMGIFVMFATQILGNIAVVSDVVPSTGIPLPLMSYGGSSVFVSMFALGIVYNVIRALYKQEMGDELDEINEVEYMM